MSTIISVTQSTNVNDTFNTTTSIKPTLSEWNTVTVNNTTGFIAQPLQALYDTIPDPRAMITFEDKAKALKERIQHKLDVKLMDIPYGLRQVLRHNFILSGSSISSIYHDEEVKDYDLWTEIQPAITAIGAHLEQHKDLIAEYQDKYGDLDVPNEKVGTKVITDKAISLQNKIQIITMGLFTELRKNFDFIHCMPYYVLSTNKFYISPLQMDLIARKKLRANPFRNEPISQNRFEKFKSRGWSWDIDVTVV